MSKTRLTARIDIKNEYVIKGIQFDGLRKLGDPNEFAKRYYECGVDEIIFMDAVASLYDRNSLSNIIERACKEVFVPITVGGGIRSVYDIQRALDSGANYASWEVDLDDQHFLMVQYGGGDDQEGARNEFLLVQNWLTELRERLGR